MNLQKLMIFTILIVTILFCSSKVTAAPPVTTGLQLWLDAGNQSSITAADGTLNDGDRISGWNDVLVGGNTVADNAVQASDANQPIWVASVPAINGYSVVRFDGIRTYLNLASLNIGANTTVFIFCQNAVQTDSTGSYWRPILSTDNDAFRDAGDGYAIALPRYGVPYNVYVYLNDDYYGQENIFGGVNQNYGYNTIILRRDGANTGGTQLRKQAVGDSNSILLDSDTFDRTTGFHTGYRIGADLASSARRYFGDIAEILIYSRTLSDAEMKSVSDYLATKYLQPINCGHPLMAYKAGDINQDCKVNFKDFAMLAEAWMECTKATDPACTSGLPAAIAKDQWNSWRKSWTTFPIAAWAYFPNYPGTLAEYQTYANANLTMVQTPLGTQMNNALAAGLKPIIGSWQNLDLVQAKLEYYVNYPSPYSTAVNGYLLRDEVKDSNGLKSLSSATAYILYNDRRGALPIVNLLPTYGTSWVGHFTDYNDYVSSYVSVVKPAVLLYDHYSILASGADRTDFYSNMELIRQKSLDAGIGFMGFALVNGLTDGSTAYRQPSESDLNWQVYSLIAYGAKGIWYYNYRIAPTGGFAEGLVSNASGAPTATYSMASSINAELKAMGPTLLKLMSTGVYHTGTLPIGTTAYTNGSISVMTGLSGTKDFVIGKFTNQDDTADTSTYVMLTNKGHSYNTTSAAQSANATFTANPTSLKVYKYDSTTGSPSLLTGSGGTYTISIGGGKGVLLRFSVN